jgi:hypothetical protein
MRPAGVGSAMASVAAPRRQGQGQCLCAAVSGGEGGERGGDSGHGG